MYQYTPSIAYQSTGNDPHCTASLFLSRLSPDGQASLSPFVLCLCGTRMADININDKQQQQQQQLLWIESVWARSARRVPYFCSFALVSELFFYFIIIFFFVCSFQTTSDEFPDCRPWRNILLDIQEKIYKRQFYYLLIIHIVSCWPQDISLSGDELKNCI